MAKAKEGRVGYDKILILYKSLIISANFLKTSCKMITSFSQYFTNSYKRIHSLSLYMFL